MSLRLMANGECDEIGKVEYMPELEVSCQSSHIAANRDDSSLMSLRLMANVSRRHINVWAKMACRYLKDRGRAAALKWLGSIINVCHDYLKMEGRVEFYCEFDVRWLDDHNEEPSWINQQKGFDRGPKRNWRNGCLISAVGSNEDDATFLFEEGTAVFLPRLDMISAMGAVVGAWAWQVGRVKLQQLGLGILGKEMNSERFEN
ncbi:hypothetical protein GOBAR_AA24361 [Gossypium barbadense]|uniref:Uncharacterized protein n=1 Tax=Gossypium barbadense TaxID=3634 RepID=A0A2P5WYZ2_GOSBA|nr:hypothetical protein GOBAR_AA24361 [Gossypium barbadense]